MKTVLAVWTVIILASLNAGFSQEETEIWSTDIEKAKMQAAAENKMVLLHFWGSFCRPCVNLDKFVFSNPRVTQTISDNFVAVKVNVEYNPQLAKEYGIRTIPHDVVISPTGRMLMKRKSPSDSDGYLRMIVGAAKSTSAVDSIPEQMEAEIAQATQGNEDVEPAFVPAGQTEISRPAFDELSSESAGRTVRQVSREVAEPVTIDNRHFADARSAPFQLKTPVKKQFVLPNAYQSAPNAVNHQPNQSPASADGEMPRSSSSFDLNSPIVANQAARLQGSNTEVTNPTQESSLSAPVSNSPIKIAGIVPNDLIGQSNSVSPQGEQVVVSEPKMESSKFAATEINATVVSQPMITTQTSETSLVDDSKPVVSLSKPIATQPLVGMLQPKVEIGQGDYEAETATNKSTNHQTPALGMDGFCPVSLYSLGQLEKGDRQWGCVHRGHLYLFTSKQGRDQFRLAPDVYSPMLAGYDAVEFGEQGDLTAGNMAYRVVHEVNEQKMLFLFASAANKELFAKEPGKYLKIVRQAISDVDKPTILR